MQLLVLSNGHGEDVIAVRILEQLQRQPHAPKLAALPIVGEGHAYEKLDIPIVGPVQQMPSGGFIYMDSKQFWRDLEGGLLNLTRSQLQSVRQWGQAGGKILAVGDVVPLLFAWLSGADYAFVGTAKSDYYLQDELGWLPQTPKVDRWLGSVYLPWERWLMSRPRCKAVFPRDTLTTKVLQQWSIPAFDLGNPMMDGLEGSNQASTINLQNSLVILLLPGSRSPEAAGNWQMILTAVQGIIAAFPRRSLVFLSAIASGLDLADFQAPLLAQNWMPQSLELTSVPLADPHALAFCQGNASLVLTQNAYADCLQIANLAIAMAGTATEQFIGLGKPAITITGEGPQFNSIFAEAQTRLLGASITLVQQPQQVVEALKNLLHDPDRWQQIEENGRLRMGTAGAAARIAQCVVRKLINSQF